MNDLEKAALHFKNNSGNYQRDGKKTLSMKFADWGYTLREKGKVSKHAAGALAAFHHATLGPKAQKEYEKLWNVGPGYFTKWHTTLWYTASLAYEHGPIFGTSLLLSLTTGISEGNYIAAGNLIGSTTQNVIRLIAAFGLKKPLPCISLISTPIQIGHYRNQIKDWAIKKHDEINAEVDKLLNC